MGLVPVPLLHRPAVFIDSWSSVDLKGLAILVDGLTAGDVRDTRVRSELLAVSKIQKRNRAVSCGCNLCV